MKRKILAAATLAVMLALTGCIRAHVMERADMYLAPVPETNQDYVVATFAMNPVLDLAEGGDGRFAWTAMFWNKNGEAVKLLALSLSQFTGEKAAKIISTKSLADFQGGHMAILDHGGTRLCNEKGECRELDSFRREINIEKYKAFLPEIKDGTPWIREVKKGSAEDKALEKMYADFRIKELDIARKYVYTRYGSNFSEKQLDELAARDSIVRGFVDWLGRDWKLFVVYPFMDIGSTALVAGVAKVFTLPSIWGDRIDRPGYLEYKPDAEATAKMILRGVSEFGAKRPSAVRRPGKQPLPDEIKASIKGTPCENALTYEAYNACTAENNRRVAERNAGRK